MADSTMHERFRVVRNRYRDDILFFGLPALALFTAGLIACGLTGRYNGLLRAIWEILRDPASIGTLPLRNPIGLLMFLVGIGIAFTAVFTLKRFYSSSLVIRVDHELVRKGPYRFVRHPIYSGVLIAVFSIPVYAASALGAILMAGLIPVILNRIRMEEALLIEEFGEAYLEYRRSVKKLIPFIY